MSEDCKFKTKIGGTIVEINKKSLAKCDTDFIAMFVSRSLVPLGREAALIAPKKSVIDNAFVELYQQGQRNYGDIIELEFPAAPGSKRSLQLLASVVPRDNVRRDETKEVLLASMIGVLRKSLKPGVRISFEAVDGNKVFAIPQAQIAEVIFEAIFYYCNRYYTENSVLEFATGSGSIAELYAVVFDKKLSSPPPLPAENAEDANFVKEYGQAQKQIYNNSGAGVLKMGLYDVFVACETHFARPKVPVPLTQIKYFLRAAHHATDGELETVIKRRVKEATQVANSAIKKHKGNPNEVFRDLFVKHLQFSREILVEALTSANKTSNMLPPSALADILPQWTGEDMYTKDDDIPGSKTSARSASTATGLKRTASEFSPTQVKGKQNALTVPGPSASPAPQRARGASTRESSTASVNSTKKKSQHASSSPKMKSRSSSNAKMRVSGSDESIKRTSSKRPEPRELKLSDKLSIIKQRMEGIQLTDANKALVELLLAEDRKLLTCIFDTTQSADLDKVAGALTKIFYFADDALNLIKEGIKSEVSKTNAGAGTLFRLNSLTTKIMTNFSKVVAREYLVTLVKPTIQRVIQSGDLEVDPAKNKDNAKVEANRKKLEALTTQLIDDMVARLPLLPVECRRICAYLKEEVSAKFPDSPGAVAGAIAGYLCLRLINPAIAAPDGFNIVLPKDMNPDARRGTVLLSKIFQNIANNVEFKKEEFMMPFNNFVQQKFESVRSFFEECANVPNMDSTHQMELKPPQLMTELQFMVNFIKLNKAKVEGSVAGVEADVAKFTQVTS